MAYKAHALLLKVPPSDVVEKKHAAGICASFTMDWLKKLAAGKTLNEATYSSTSRIDKMVRRQEKYEKTGELESLAKNYSMTIERAGYAAFQFGGDNANDLINGLPAAYYYVSLALKDGGGHALGLNSHGAQFCDVNVGILGTAPGFIQAFDEARGIYGVAAATFYKAQLRT